MLANFYEKALELDYEQFCDFIQEQIESMLHNTDMNLQEAVQAVVSELFVNLDNHPDALAKVMQEAKDTYEPSIETRDALESQLVDQLIEAIHDNELYMAHKTGTKPNTRWI